MVGSARLASLFRLLAHFAGPKEVSNSMAGIVTTVLRLGERAKDSFKSDRQTVSFMQQLLSNQQCSLFLLYLLKHKSLELISLFALSKYLPFAHQPLLSQTVIRVLLHRHKDWAEEQ
jgi:hypothetical protein